MKGHHPTNAPWGKPVDRLSTNGRSEGRSNDIEQELVDARR